jgi:protein-L-isoaspartate(D-aspartate) O-methyltransferase
MDFARARSNMVEQQIRPWEVLDPRVLAVLETLPREAFVTGSQQGLAYADLEIPLMEGETMLAPKVVGRLLQAIAAHPEDHALEIGTGSGYVTACLARLCAAVDSVERLPLLHQAASARLQTLGLFQARLIHDTVTPAWHPPGQRYDLIVCTGSMATADPFLQPFLALGGRLFVVVGTPPLMQARLITRVAEQSYRTEVLFETCLRPLAGFAAQPAFVF